MAVEQSSLTVHSQQDKMRFHDTLAEGHLPHPFCYSIQCRVPTVRAHTIIVLM
jgi:hypothetical protein